MKVGQSTAEDEAEIATPVTHCYENLFKEDNQWRPTLESDSFRQISNVEAVELIIPFTEEEIKEVVYNMKATKSP